MAKDYAVEVRVRNGKLLATMRAAGFQTAAELSRASGVNQGPIGDLLNLAAPAKRANGMWTKPVIELSEFLRCMPEDIVPKAHYSAALAINKSEVFLTADQIQALLPADGEAGFFQREAANIIGNTLGTLSPRERDILERRFGLVGHEETLEEIGRSYGITKTRVSAIEECALRKLRHPSRARDLTLALESFQ